MDGPTDGPTKRVVESRSTRLKINGMESTIPTSPFPKLCVPSDTPCRYEIDPDALKAHVADTVVTVNQESIVRSDTMKALALHIIDAFHIVIFNLSNYHSRDVVKEIGYAHSKYHGRINDTDINGFCQAVINAVQYLLGSAFRWVRKIFIREGVIPETYETIIISSYNQSLQKSNIQPNTRM